MGGKKKYINIFGSFTEPFNCAKSKVALNPRNLSSKQRPSWRVCSVTAFITWQKASQQLNRPRRWTGDMLKEAAAWIQSLHCAYSILMYLNRVRSRHRVPITLHYKTRFLCNRFVHDNVLLPGLVWLLFCRWLPSTEQVHLFQCISS